MEFIEFVNKSPSRYHAVGKEEFQFLKWFLGFMLFV